jgi:Ca2+-binding RTX toxin-like protein
MTKYITAKGVELLLSGTTSNWVANSSAKEAQVGTAKNDVFQGSGGDTLTGGLGDDYYYLWDSTSVAVEKSGEGIDTIDARFWGPVTLSANIENLFLNSAGSTAGTGNALNNIIVAGTVGATLNGMAGDDVLVGGAGADLFKVIAGNGSDAIMNFKPSSDVIQLTGYGVTTFAQLQSLGTQVGSDVRYTFSNGETLVIRDVTLSSLTAYDFGLKADATVVPTGYSQLTGPGSAWTAHGWYVLDNVWNPGTLVYNKDYTISATYSASDMTAKTTFDWSFPVVTDAYPTIRAYPEVIFGPAPMSGGLKASDITGVFPVQVSSLTQLTAAYDVSYKGNTSGFNVAFDIWLTNTSGGGSASTTAEVMVWVHKGGFEASGTLVGTYTDGTHTAKIYTSNTGSWIYTAVVFDQDVPQGEIDIAAILKQLTALKLVSASDYVASVELGAEVVSGAGSLTINNLDLDVKSANADGSTTVMHVDGSGTTTATVAAAAPVVDKSADAVTAAPDLSGDDTVIYDATAAKVSGGAGHDTLVLQAGATVNLADTVNQVAGATAVVTGFEDVDASAASAAVVLNGSDGANTLIGSAFADTLVGGGGVDVLNGGAGNDYLDGGTGSDQLRGEAGDDRIVYDAADTVIDGGAGIDTLILNGAATVNLGNVSSSQVVGGAAYVSGFENVDASAATAAVTLTGSDASNKLVGGAFADTLMGGGGADLLYGGAGADYLDGGAGADQVRGEAGDDRIVYDAADTVIDGGAGVDTLILNVAGTVNLGNFSSSQLVGGSAYVSGFENVDASAAIAAVTLNGSDYNNKLVGSAFADTLMGGAGFDLLYGGAGNDYLDGGADSDQVRGEAGDDRIVYDAADTIIDGGAGTDTLILKAGAIVHLENFSSSQVTGGVAYVSGFENVDGSAASAAINATGSDFNNTLVGSAFADTLMGGGGVDILNGGAGNDYLDGGAGADQVRGEAGDDRIVYDSADTVIDGGAGADTLILKIGATVNLGNFSTSQVVGGSAYVSGFENVDASGATSSVTLNGSQFNNTLVGGAGNDKIAGGAGFDTLTGGAGSDLFVFGAFTSGDIDKITDFSSAQGDRIDLSAIDAVAGGVDDPFSFIGQSAFHHVAGEVRFGATSGGVLVQADVNGDGYADFSILMTNVSTLSHTDFIL